MHCRTESIAAAIFSLFSQFCRMHVFRVDIPNIDVIWPETTGNKELFPVAVAAKCPWD